MKLIAEILAAHYKGKLDNNQAVRRLMLECTAEELADFIVDAKNRGWITNYNLGLNDEGEFM